MQQLVEKSISSKAPNNHQHRGRHKIGEKSPISLVRLATQNFNDLARNTRYQQQQSFNSQQDSQQDPHQQQLVDQQSSPTGKQKLPQLRSRWVSMEASSGQNIVSQDVAAAHQIQFQAPREDIKFNQRVSLDYSRIENMIRKTQENKNKVTQASTKKEKILRLIGQQQNTTIVPGQQALLSQTPRISDQQPMFATQNNFSNHRGARNMTTMYKSVDASFFKMKNNVADDVSNSVGIPAHFEYPQTNMATTCNYFSANDYKSKQTMNDIRMKVIEERSSRKKPPLANLCGINNSLEHQFNRRNLNRTLQVSEQSSEIQSLQQTQNKTARQFHNKAIVSPKQIMISAELNNQVRQLSKVQVESSTLDEPRISTKGPPNGTKTGTPDGCKGVQIDSSMDMHEEQSSYLEHTKAKLVNTNEMCNSEEHKKEDHNNLIPKIQMSTQLFNGDYLVQTVNQNTPSMQASPYNSRAVLPNQFISGDQSQPMPQYKTQKGTASLSQSKHKNNKAPPQQHEQRYPHHQVTYFAGDQINQINLHVHFSSSSQTPEVNTIKNKKQQYEQLPKESNKKDNVSQNYIKENKILQKISTLNDSENLQKPLIDQNDSKQTLNQSSSKILQQANAIISRQTVHGQLQPPYEQRLNKYSSLKTQNLPKDSPLTRLDQNRLEQGADQLQLQKQTTSTDILQVTQKKDIKPVHSILGVDLNSTDSGKSKSSRVDSSKKFMINTLKSLNQAGVEIQNQTTQIFNKNAQMVMTTDDQQELNDEYEESSITPEIVRNQNDLSKLTNGRSTVHTQAMMKEQQNEAKMADYNDSSEKGDPAEQLYQNNAEDVINQILNKLTQQKQSATIKITTHKNTKNKKQQPLQQQQKIEANSNQPTVRNSVRVDRQKKPVSQSRMSMSHAKQNKMKRSSLRQNTIEPKPIPKLHIHDYITRKVSGNPHQQNQQQYLFQDQQNSQQQQLFSTIQDGFKSQHLATDNDFDMMHRSATVTQGPFHSRMMNNTSGLQNNFNTKIAMPDMYRTIMQPAARWNSVDFTGAHSERGRINFDPNQTGFSIISQNHNHQQRQHNERQSSYTRPENFNQTLYSSEVRPFSLEMQPEIIAAANGESSVLFKIDPAGQVGRFRPRQKRKRETFNERNSRLGNMATRTSGALNKSRKVQDNSDIKVGGNSFLKEGFALVPEMLRTGSTTFSKLAEREITNLELTMITPTSQPGSPIKQLVARGDNDQEVIYEESVNEAHAEQTEGDAYSHISQSQQTNNLSQDNQLIKRMEQSQERQNRKQSQIMSTKNQGTSSLDVGGQEPHEILKYQQQRPPFLGGIQQLAYQQIQQPLSPVSPISPAKLQQIMGNLNQRIIKDKLMIDKIQQIQDKNKMLEIAANKSPIHKNQHHYMSRTAAFKQSHSKSKAAKNKDSSLSVFQQNELRESSIDSGIKQNEMLVGQSIYSIMRNNTWSVIGPHNIQSNVQNSPGIISKKSPQQQHLKNKTQILVIQTPETPHINNQEELRQRLDIKIRCPSQLLLPEVINAINRKLDLTISLIYFDGSQPLDSIQSGAGARYVLNQVSLNQQGFVVHNERQGQAAQTKWNIYEDMFKGQLRLQDLNFMHREFILEIELTDPRSKDIYLLRYLTFNQMTQTVYPKIFITIMQHLGSKKRPLRMFDGMALEVLDYNKEASLQDGTTGLDKLFEELVIKGINYSIMMRKKPRIECPPIRMKGIILESPKRKVQIKGLGEFISLTDGLFNRPKLHITSNQASIEKTGYHESRETLHPDQSDSQYVAVALTNHELPTRTLQGSDLSKDGHLFHDNGQTKSSLSKIHTSSIRHLAKIPSKDRQNNASPLQNPYQSSPTYRSKQMKLNYDSASRILFDQQQNVLNPCIQVKKIGERPLPQTPPKKPKEEPKPINKQQFHIDPNLDKGIDCSFEALGSSEGRHSVNESITPGRTPGSTKHRRQRRLQRFSSSVVDEHESGDESKRVINDDLDTVAQISRQNLNFNSNMSELEDEHNDTFGPFGQNDRLQSIFTMNKKESDLEEHLREGLLMITGASKTELKHTQIKYPKHKRNMDFSKGDKKSKSKEKDQSQAKYQQAQSNNTDVFLPKGSILLPQDQDKINVAPLISNLAADSGDSQNNRQQQDAQMSMTDYDELQQITQGSELRPKMIHSQLLNKKEAAKKSIVNILADQVIKEPKEPAKHRVSGLSHMNKRTLTRRSNLKHALADEKSKRLLENDQRTNPLTKSNLQIERKQIQMSVPPAKSPKRSRSPHVPAPETAIKQPEHLESVESEVNSARRESLASQGHQLNPTLTEIGPEIIIVKQTKKKVNKRDTNESSLKRMIGGGDQTGQFKRQISFEKGGKALQVQIFSEELVLPKNNKQSNNNNSKSKVKKQSD